MDGVVGDSDLRAVGGDRFDELEGDSSGEGNVRLVLRLPVRLLSYSEKSTKESTRWSNPPCDPAIAPPGKVTDSKCRKIRRLGREPCVSRLSSWSPSQMGAGIYVNLRCVVCCCVLCVDLQKVQREERVGGKGRRPQGDTGFDGNRLAHRGRRGMVAARQGRGRDVCRFGRGDA